MNNVYTEKEMQRSNADKPANPERLEKLEGALEKMKIQGAWLQSLLEGE